jgi:hypothetical protein
MVNVVQLQHYVVLNWAYPRLMIGKYYFITFGITVCHLLPYYLCSHLLSCDVTNRNANYLLVCDGVDKLLNDSNGETGGPLNIRGFLEDLFQTTKIKVLATCCDAIGALNGSAEWVKKLKMLSPADAAQLFWDLRPRDIPLSEFGCTDPQSAGAVLSQHRALKMLGGHPRRIFWAAGQLMEKTMKELPDILQKKIELEEKGMHSPDPYSLRDIIHES